MDGVLTDGTILLHADGSESKTFCLQDGHGIKMWKRAGLEVVLLSGRPSPATGHRARQLEIDQVYEGCHEKLPVLQQILLDKGLSPDQVVYVGDDVLDLPCVRYVGFGVAVANAVAELKHHAAYVTEAPGGRGAVREVIEWVLKRAGKWEVLMQRYLPDGP